MATSLGSRSKRPPRTLSIVLTILTLFIVLAPVAVRYFTDWMWFGEVDFRGVFTQVLFTRIALFAIFGAVAAFIVWLAGFMAFRYRPDTLDVLELDSPVHGYRRLIEQSLRKLLLGIPLFVGVIAGIAGQSAWRTVSLFLNRESFGKQDPQFGMDYGFYAFSLPMFHLVVDSLSVLLALAFFVAVIGHYLLGSIRAGSPTRKGFVSSAARVQLAITAGLWMLVKVADYWLERYDLLGVQHTTFTGGSYTDLHAYLPAKIVLMVIAALVAVAFFSTIVLHDMRIPALATVLMLLSAGVIGVAWPLMMEQFSVAPNRAQKEAESIRRNIEATRFAYGLTDDKVTYQRDWGSKSADKKSAEAVAADEATVSNIRLLDPEVLSDTFTQQQQLKNFYGFPETLSIDRYETDGQLRDYVVAAREMDPNALSGNQNDWINKHTVYTHGNGFIAAPANQVDEVARDVGSTRGGYPMYSVADLQAQERNAKNPMGLEVVQPRLYYGPVISDTPRNVDYAIVGTQGTPVEYDADGVNFTYDGKGGVDISNMFNRTMFAARYQELNLLLSDRIGEGSKIIYERDPRGRVQKVAPWLTTDSATYPAIIDGRVKWIVDGYTTLNNLPYSQRTSLTEATEDALNPDGTNQALINERTSYIRNSVKATVDAYDGTVELYEFDTEDPVLKAWKGVFPNTVKPKSSISDELNKHLRYPEDMFKVQRELIAKYHVDDPGVFFTNDAFWSVPSDPTAVEQNRKDKAQPPYHVVAADPETGKPSFQLITPFRGLNRDFLAAHMTASSDPENYGKITVRVLPTNTQTQGPKQAQDTMMSSDQIARDRALWEQTNKLSNGNLLTLPVGDGEILYVEPIYTQRKDQKSAFPKLLRVLVSYDGKVGYAPTIAEALSQVGIDPRAANDLKDAKDVPKAPEATGDTASPSQENKAGDVPVSAPANATEALAKVNEAMDKLNKAKSSSHEEYGKALDELDRAMAEFRRAQEAPQP
ncbi:UPF0182 family protein [Corynebacterium epidermidicanis]|uniref:UPF0182 protein CEPID_03445 n=1 Tax=Corynebacterium epidermidicanis TaxID=1050174 RepID=A0A0G3GN37_9CORY|nr:UPF0182 family protein [Corynebacterium epidermidicanis]AKK02569.1 hypothetical protein CEPID_03445 [Corynebacterium epidermidicanis]